MLISVGRPKRYVHNDVKNDAAKMPTSAEIVDVSPANMETDSISNQKSCNESLS